MTGTVLSGRFAGMRLEEMSRADLIALLRECRTGDEDGARLVEAYLDRAHPDWRDDLGRDDFQAEHGPRRSAGPDLPIDEAYAILGLSPGATKDAIRDAHHRLMKQLHPDHGGSDYLAGKINRARDVLLGQR
jgi:DnaJ-domain-containing protein 1